MRMGMMFGPGGKFPTQTAVLSRPWVWCYAVRSVARGAQRKAPITRPVAPSERLREERNMVSLSNWSLHSLTHRREIRSIASAFVGEIAAILHLIETHDVVAMA